jgi:hypothetical protein
MIITKKSLPRRTFLRGAGVALALPWLDAMMPAFAVRAQATSIRRFAGLYLPHGMIMTNFTPETDGTGFELPPILKSLEPYRDQVVVVTGANGPRNLDNGGHAYAPSSWLTGATAKKTQGSDIHLGESLDQVLAREIGQETLLPSLELATEDFTSYVGACETGFSCSYMNTLSWSSPTTPLPMETNPRVVFERLFGAPGTSTQRLERLHRNQSVLDSVRAKAATLRIGLGSQDRSRMDDYLENLREIERRIKKAETQAASTAEVPDAPPGVPARRADHVALLFDLVAIAWEADLTRVTSFMMGRDVTYQSYPEIGITEGHHPLSHHGNNPEKMARFSAINAYETQFFARFLDRLRTTRDGDGTLLDNSIVFFGSGMSGGNTHSTTGLPIVIAGGGAGRIKGGRHLRHPVSPSDGIPLGNVLLSIGHRMGLEIERQGQSTGTIDL